MGATRHLPPMGSLRAFEAAARLGSFTAAAQQLNVTQSAVSQAVQQLEALVATPLFERRPGRLALTAAGRRYASAVAPLLDQLAEATAQLINTESRRLSIGCTRSVLQHWLLARLPRFQEAHPQLELQVMALGLLNEALGPANDCDVAIILADEADRPAGADCLAVERLIAVAAPQLVDVTGLRLEALPGLPAIARLGSAWPRWFDAAGISVPDVPANAIRLRETSTVVQAALAGQGIALISWLTCINELRAGRLVRVSDIMVDRSRRYWLLRPPARRRPAVTAFVDWLSAEVPAELRAQG